MPSFLATVWYVLVLFVSYVTIALDVSLFASATLITTPTSLLTNEDSPVPSSSTTVAQGSIKIGPTDGHTPSSNARLSVGSANPSESTLAPLTLLSQPPAPLASSVYYIPPGYHVKIVKDGVSPNSQDGEEELLEEEYDDEDEGEGEDDDESKEQRINDYEAWIKHRLFRKRATLTNRHAAANASEFKAKSREDEREPLEVPSEENAAGVLVVSQKEEQPHDAKVLRDATFPPAPTFTVVSSREREAEVSSSAMHKNERREEQSPQRQVGTQDVGIGATAYVTDTEKIKGVISSGAGTTTAVSDQQATTTTAVPKAVVQKKKRDVPASFDDLYIMDEEKEKEASKKRQHQLQEKSQSATSSRQERRLATPTTNRQQDLRQEKGHAQQRPMANGVDTSSAYSFESGLLSGGLASPQAFLMLLALIVLVSAVVVYTRNLALERLGLLRRKKEGKSRGGRVSVRGLASTVAAGEEGVYEELASEAEPKSGEILHV